MMSPLVWILAAKIDVHFTKLYSKSDDPKRQKLIDEYNNRVDELGRLQQIAVLLAFWAFYFWP